MLVMFNQVVIFSNFSLCLKPEHLLICKDIKAKVVFKQDSRGLSPKAPKLLKELKKNN